jgi:hypothetical protein
MMLISMLNSWYGSLMTLAALTSALALPVAAAKTDCVANVRVTNQQRTAIKVLNFTYKIDGSNTIHTEKLENKLVAMNETANWPGQTLTAATAGILVSASAVEYQVFKTNGTIGDYGPARMSPWFQTTISCGQGYDYVHYIDE